jgi:hypothetical protein
MRSILAGTPSDPPPGSSGPLLTQPQVELGAIWDVPGTSQVLLGWHSLPVRRQLAMSALLLPRGLSSCSLTR